MEMPRETALLLALLTQLQRQWTPLADVSDIRSQLLSLGVSASPSVSFRTAGSETVDVRGLAIGDKLFVHFVARETSIRLDLLWVLEGSVILRQGLTGRNAVCEDCRNIQSSMRRAWMAAPMRAWASGPSARSFFSGGTLRSLSPSFWEGVWTEV
jgi:hypothetical protein